MLNNHWLEKHLWYRIKTCLWYRPAGKPPAGKSPVILTKKGAVTQEEELVSQRVNIEI
jgi:hypothetical protein